MICDEDVQRLFRDMLSARRAITDRQADLAQAEAAAKQAQVDLDDAKQALNTIEGKIQGLVDRAAGVRPREIEAESPPRLHSEFRAIRR